MKDKEYLHSDPSSPKVSCQSLVGVNDEQSTDIHFSCHINMTKSFLKSVNLIVYAGIFMDVCTSSNKGRADGLSLFRNWELNKYESMVARY